MAKRRQILLINPVRTGVRGGMMPLGTLDEVTQSLSAFNTAMDGSPRSARSGTILMHGPGLVVEIANGIEPVTQAMVTLMDEDMAWPVLMRLTKRTEWAMTDIETGRTFG